MRRSTAWLLVVAVGPLARAAAAEDSLTPGAVRDHVQSILGSAPVSRERLLARPPLHEKYVPREVTQRSPRSARHPRTAPGPLPKIPSYLDQLEDPERLHRQWDFRRSPEEEQALIAAALAIPDEPETGDGQRATAWSPIGSGIHDPDGLHHKAGRIRAAAYAFDDSQGLTTLWLGSAGGGLWKFLNLGPFSFWVPVSTTLPGSPAVGAFLVHPLDSERSLIGTGDYKRYWGSGMYRTTDGGRSWGPTALSPAPPAFYRIVSDWSVPSRDTVLASGDNGIWRSTDFGATWSWVYGVGRTTDLAQDPVYPDYWYAGQPLLGVLESSDGGLSFHPIDCGDACISNNPDPIGRVSLSVCAAAASLRVGRERLE
jgi:hypothetical protein